MSPDWTASLKRREHKGNKLLPQDREEQLGVPWGAVSWAGLSPAPLCFLVFPLPIHPNLPRTEILVWIQVLQSIWSGLWPISYDFTTLKYLKLRHNFIFGSVAYNSNLKKIKIFPLLLRKHSKYKQYFCMLESVFIFCIKSEDTFSNYFLLSRENCRTIFPSCLLWFEGWRQE